MGTVLVDETMMRKRGSVMDKSIDILSSVHVSDLKNMDESKPKN